MPTKVATLLAGTVLLCAASAVPAAAAENDFFPEAPKATLPACAPCGGSGEADCSNCKSTGKSVAKCSLCKGRDTVECSAVGCDVGARICRTCRGAGFVERKVLGVQGGTSIRRRACSTCKGGGTTSCRLCKSGLSACPRCKGGRKKFRVQCSVCGGKKKAPCDGCGGTGVSSPSPLATRVVGSLKRTRARLARISKQAEEIRVTLESHAHLYAGQLEVAGKIAADFERIRAVEKGELTQYLARYRENLVNGWARYTKRHIENSDRSRELAELDQRARDHRDLAATIEAGVERILRDFDGRSDDDVLRLLPRLTRRVGKTLEAGDALELEIVKSHHAGRQLKKETRAIRGHVVFFNDKLVVHRKLLEKQNKSGARPQDRAIADVVARRTIERTIDRLVIEAPLPWLKLVTLATKLEGKGLDLEVEYVDGKARRRAGDHVELSEEYLSGVPAVVTELFESREDVTKVTLRIRTQRRASPAGDAVSSAVVPAEESRAIQTFVFDREHWSPLALRTAGNTDPDGAAATGGSSVDWRSLLSASHPTPPFPSRELTVMEAESAPDESASSDVLLVVAFCCVLGGLGVFLVWLSKSRFRLSEALSDDA